MGHCQWCGGDIVSSAGSVEHCEFVKDVGAFHREADGHVIGCDEEALKRIRNGELPWGMEEEDRSGHGRSKFPRFKVQISYEYTPSGEVTGWREEEYLVSDEDLDERAECVREVKELEDEVDRAAKVLEIEETGSEAWQKAYTFLKEIGEQEKLEQQEEACNRWL